MFLMKLDKETLTNVFLGEAFVDLVQLLPEDDCTLFWYLCPPALHTIWWRYLHVMCDLVSYVSESGFCESVSAFRR